MNNWYKYWRAPYRKNSISISLLLAHGLIIVSYALFLHTHKLEDGRKIVHAHPFMETQSQDNNPGSQPDRRQHDHTTFSYTLLDNLGHLFKENFSGFSFISHKEFLHPKTRNHFAASLKIFHSALRAPPIL